MAEDEQAWAVLYQCSSLLKRIWRQRQRDRQPIFPVELDSVCLASDGSVDVQWQGNKENGLVAATRRKEVLASLGWAVYRGLDYGLPDDEERDLQDDLERLIMCMTHKVSEEGEREDIDFDSVIQACRARLPLYEQANVHYRSVCRSLVNRAKRKSHKQNEDIQVAETYELQGKISAYDSLPDVVPNEWMVHWMHVVDELRQGVKLQEAIQRDGLLKGRYELTPYEKLMDTIRNPPQLNSALELAEIYEGMQQQRSHPHLKPVGSRKLAVKLAEPLTPMERLMQEIQSPPELRRACTHIQSEPVFGNMSHEERASTPVGRVSSSPAAGRSPVTVRRKLKARTLVELFYEAEDTESWESVGSSTQSCSSTVDTVVSEDGGLAAKQRILSDSEDIRGSPTLQEGTSSISDDCQLRVPTIVTEPAGPTGCRRKLDLSPSLRQRWEEDKASRKPVVTLDELRHIREVLDRALLESLETEDEALCLALKMGKICSSCRDTRFSFFDRNRVCDVCVKRVCSKCLLKVSMPSHYVDDRFRQQQKSRAFQRSQSFRLVRRPSLRKKSGRPTIQAKEIHNPLAVYDDEVEEALRGPKTVEVDMCSSCRKLLGGIDVGGEKESNDIRGSLEKSPLMRGLVDIERRVGHLTAMPSDGAPADRSKRAVSRTKRVVTRLSRGQSGLHSEEVFV